MRRPTRWWVSVASASLGLLLGVTTIAATAGAAVVDTTSVGPGAVAAVAAGVTTSQVQATDLTRPRTAALVARHVTRPPYRSSPDDLELPRDSAQLAMSSVPASPAPSVARSDVAAREVHARAPPVLV